MVDLPRYGVGDSVMVMAWDDPKCAPHVRAAAAEIRDRFGITNIGGWRATGSVSNSDHPKGLATDVMTVLKAPAVADWAIANATRLSITYVIWNRQIWYPGKGWSRYTGPSPHTDHVHISYRATAGPGGANVDSLTGSGSGSTDDPLSGCLKALLDMFNPLA